MAPESRWHIEKKEKDDFDVILYNDYPDEDFLWYFALTCRMLADAACGVHTLLGAEVLAEIKQLKDNLDNFDGTSNNGLK